MRPAGRAGPAPEEQAGSPSRVLGQLGLGSGSELGPRSASLASVYRQLGQTVEADRIQKTLNQLRGGAASAPRAIRGDWPRYAP
jgi:hypothetical protein